MTTKRIQPGDGDPRHGTQNGYTNLKCRCQFCRDAWATYHHARGYQTKYRDKLTAKGMRRDSPTPRTTNYMPYGPNRSIRPSKSED